MDSFWLFFLWQIFFSHLSIASRIQHSPAFSGGKIRENLDNLLEDSHVFFFKPKFSFARENYHLRSVAGSQPVIIPFIKLRILLDKNTHFCSTNNACLFREFPWVVFLILSQFRATKLWHCGVVIIEISKICCSTDDMTELIMLSETDSVIYKWVDWKSWGGVK